MQRLTTTRYAHILYDLTRELPAAEVPAAIRVFLQLVAKRRAQRSLPKIVAAFQRLALEREQIVAVHLTTAQPLAAAHRHQVERALADAVGRRVVTEEAVDRRIIGGLVVRIGDTVIDGSIRSRLAQVAERFGLAAAEPNSN